MSRRTHPVSPPDVFDQRAAAAFDQPVGPTIAELQASGNLAPLLELTDWIPCTTPPVREGVYEFRLCEDQPLFVKDVFKRAEFASGKWFSVKDGGSLWAMDERPDAYQWRGVRRWVLVQQRPEGKFGNGPFYLQRIPKSGRRTGVPHWHFDLAEAMGFDSQADAVAYADKHALTGWKAVLA